MSTKTAKIVTKESLLLMLEEADTARKKLIVGRALAAVYQFQTDEEKVTSSAKEHNGVGFTRWDAELGVQTAQYYLRHKTLTNWQLDKWLNKGRIAKYHRQLNAVAEAKILQGRK